MILLKTNSSCTSTFIVSICLFAVDLHILSLCLWYGSRKASSNTDIFVALTYMEIMKTRCGDGRSMVGSARTCVNKMVAGSLKTNLGNNMEQLGGALNPSFNEANQGTCVLLARKNMLAPQFRYIWICQSL